MTKQPEPQDPSVPTASNEVEPPASSRPALGSDPGASPADSGSNPVTSSSAETYFVDPAPASASASAGGELGNGDPTAPNASAELGINDRAPDGSPKMVALAAFGTLAALALLVVVGAFVLFGDDDPETDGTDVAADDDPAGDSDEPADQLAAGDDVDGDGLESDGVDNGDLTDEEDGGDDANTADNADTADQVEPNPAEDGDGDDEPGEPGEPGERTVTGPLVPESGVLIGAYVEASGSFVDDARRQDILTYEGQIGRTLDVSHDFFAFDHDIKTARSRWNLDRGVTPMITWHGGEADETIDGTFDNYIRIQARRLLDIPEPFFFRYHHEPDSTRSRDIGYGGEEGAAKFVEAWRRVHRIFAEEGVTNAVWVWSPTNTGFEVGRAAGYYPGDDVVDWIASDPYRWSPCKGDGTQTLATKIADFLDWAEPRNKPLMLAEWGAGHDPRDAQAEFLRSAEDVLIDHPNLAALIYFNTSGKESEGWCRWRVEEDENVLNSYRDLITSPVVTGG